MDFIIILLDCEIPDSDEAVDTEDIPKLSFNLNLNLINNINLLNKVIKIDQAFKANKINQAFKANKIDQVFKANKINLRTFVRPESISFIQPLLLASRVNKMYFQ